MKVYKPIKKETMKALFRVIKCAIRKGPKLPYHNGILVKVPANECFIRQGYPVMTLEGDTGLISSFYTNLLPKNISQWIDVKLADGKFRHIMQSNCFVLFMYFPTTNKYYPLSHSCYRFILPTHIYKVFSFRITKRNYAMLSDSFLLEYEYVAKLAKSRHSGNLIKRIESLNYKIKKQ